MNEAPWTLRHCECTEGCEQYTIADLAGSVVKAHLDHAVAAACANAVNRLKAEEEAGVA